MSKILGIDLGTTNSCAAILEGGTPKIIINNEGNRTTPSVIAYTKDGERLVGTTAKRQSITNPNNTVFSIKRFMGLPYQDAKNEIKNVSYDVKSLKGACAILIDGKSISPPEISAQILQKLKREAETYTGTSITEAVITVPAYFNDAQRQATKDAGKIAGLDVKRIINEPTAAALAYGIDNEKESTVVVYDFGGGTFDVSVLEIGDGVIEVKATNGNTHLGGDDIDNIVTAWIINEFKAETGIDLSKDKSALQRLNDAAEKAKIELSSAQQTDINLPFLTADAAGPKHFQKTLQRSKFEQMIEKIIKKTITPIKNALKDANFETSEINEIILIGGSTRIPAVRNAITEFFGKEPNQSVNPDEAVALGAAIQGGVISGDVTDLLLLDVTPLSLGIETLGGIMTHLITRNTTIPCEKSETFSTAADNQTAVDIVVYQGERKMASSNKLLGRFQLSGFPPALRGVPQIEVSFNIDANGIVNVTAKDKATGKEQSIQITSSSGLSESEIEKMVNDAESHAEEDALRFKVVMQKNTLDNMIHSCENFVNNDENTLTDDQKSTLNEAIESAKTSSSSDNLQDLEACFSQLEGVFHNITAELYQQNTTSQDTSDDSTNSDDDVIDVEFSEDESSAAV